MARGGLEGEGLGGGAAHRRSARGRGRRASFVHRDGWRVAGKAWGGVWRVAGGGQEGEGLRALATGEDERARGRRAGFVHRDGWRVAGKTWGGVWRVAGDGWRVTGGGWRARRGVECDG